MREVDSTASNGIYLAHIRNIQKDHARVDRHSVSTRMGSWLLLQVLLRHPTAATTEEKYIFQQAPMYRLLSSEVRESHCPRLDRPYTMTGMVGSAQR